MSIIYDNPMYVLWMINSCQPNLLVENGSESGKSLTTLIHCVFYDLLKLIHNIAAAINSSLHWLTDWLLERPFHKCPSRCFTIYRQLLEWMTRHWTSNATKVILRSGKKILVIKTPVWVVCNKCRDFCKPTSLLRLFLCTV